MINMTIDNYGCKATLTNSENKTSIIFEADTAEAVCHLLDELVMATDTDELCVYCEQAK